MGAETAVEVETKPCTKCKLPKPVDEFGRDPNGRVGLRSECKACCTARHNARYAADPEYREAVRQRNAAYKASELGGLVSKRAEVLGRLRGAVKPATKERQRRRIAELDQQIAALRAGQERSLDAA